MEIAKTKFKHKCPKHPDMKVEFLQIDNLDANQKDKNLFYCSDCAQQDSTFNFQNYCKIQQIIKSKTDEILPRWPPVNNDKLIDQLIQNNKANQDTNSIIAQIETYFADLKNEILKQIDICQKKMIKFAQEIPENMIQIMDRYTELSRINEFRTVLSDNNSHISEKNKTYRVLFDKILSEKKVITEQLTSLLDQCQQKQTIFNAEAALDIKESILQSISSINLFQSHNNIPILNHNNDNNNNNNKQIKLDLSLIKTDYNDGQNCQEITKNENNQYQVQIIKQNGNWYNTVSNIELQRNKKYIFRIEIPNMTNGQTCIIGLMQSANINTQAGFNDYLSCNLRYNNNQISKQSDHWGIGKVVKGNEFALSNENMIEMKVCIEDQILEVLDYPNYRCKLALQDQYKYNLINSNNLRLYLGLAYQNSKMIIKEALTVEQFE